MIKKRSRWLIAWQMMWLTLWRALHFMGRVLVHFSHNRGLLLAGGVAYNTLLSIVPLTAVALVVLSRVFDEEQLLAVIGTELELIVPGHAQTLMGEVTGFLEHWEMIGTVGLVVLLFFSSLAFRMLEEAVGAIFSVAPHHRPKRSFWVSAMTPYIYVLLIGVGLLVLTAASILIEAVASGELRLFGLTLSLPLSTSLLLYLFSVLGMTALFTSVYRVLPTARVALRRAMIGGFIAALLWDLTRRVLTWYFTSISLVSVVYGSLATVIIVLLTMEVAAIIILLSGQVIAELERSAAAGMPWYEDPETRLEEMAEARRSAAALAAAGADVIGSSAAQLGAAAAVEAAARAKHAEDGDAGAGPSTDSEPGAGEVGRGPQGAGGVDG